MPFCHAPLQAPKPRPPKYPQELKTLGDHIRKRRLDLGLLQKEVAERIGVDEGTLFNWERNKTLPQIRHIPKITQFLGYNPLSCGGSFPDTLKGLRKVLGLMALFSVGIR
ncbi:MAG: helix-turn-helix domain-containing protein [Candidatus Binatia bacterium]